MNFIKEYQEKYSALAAQILDALGEKPDIIIVAGSGVAESIKNFEIIKRINFSEIPKYPMPSVSGHSGEFILAQIREIKVLFISGRVHLYEGRDLFDLLAPVGIALNMGVKNLVMTNAAGGANPLYYAGDIMLIEDAINFTFKGIDHILEGDNFSAHADIFSPNWRNKIHQRLIETNIPVQKGVYYTVSGPSYETPAEIRMYQRIGADAMGMSTVLEAACAAQLGINTAGCSVITNKLKPNSPDTLSHEEVLRIAAESEAKLAGFIIAATETCEI